MNTPDVVDLPENAYEWKASLEKAHIDYVPDPMVLRSAELLLLGQGGSRHFGEPEKVWGVISKNLDGVVTFFHLLLTRERIPLIDYHYTFGEHHFVRLLGDIAVPVHAAPAVYQAALNDAQRKVRELDFTRIPTALVTDIAAELGDAGYEWFPDPGTSPSAEQRIIASFVMGGAIFGAYAQITGTDHVLQTKRSRAMATLAVDQSKEPLWGHRRERELFKRLCEIINRDQHLAAHDFVAPPSILPLILSQKDPPTTTGALLEQVLEHRDTDLGGAYRAWHNDLRGAWALGRHDFVAEASVEAVRGELARRFNLAAEQIRTQDDSRGTAIQIEVAFGPVKASTEVRPSVPPQLRNWLADNLLFRRHRKLLLRMSLAQRSFDNLTMALKRLWSSS